MKIIFTHESGSMQFSTGLSNIEMNGQNPIPGFPLISVDGWGCGLGQFTFDATFADHWDWHYNAGRSLNLLRDKFQGSKKREDNSIKLGAPPLTVKQHRVDVYQRYYNGIGEYYDGSNWLESGTFADIVVGKDKYGILRESEEEKTPGFGPPTQRPILKRSGKTALKYKVPLSK